MPKFEKGTSGNPAGKPKGARDKRTELRALLEPHAGALVGKAVALALAGDTAALRMCIDRLIAPAKARDSAVNLGAPVGTLADQGRAVLAAVFSQGITPEEGERLMQAIALQSRLVEAAEIEERISALEKTLAS